MLKAMTRRWWGGWPAWGMVLVCVSGAAAGEEPPAGLSSSIPAELFKMPRAAVQSRWYTFENQKGVKGGGGQAKFGRKGSPATWIKPGESFTPLDVPGSGTVRRIWITTDPQTPEALRGVKVEMYWDGSATPAVQGPLGDFFGHSLGQMVRFENACFSSPEGRSCNCIVPMPFKKGARIVVTNESGKLLTFFYDIAVTLGEPHGDDVLYFHSY